MTDQPMFTAQIEDFIRDRSLPFVQRSPEWAEFSSGSIGGTDASKVVNPENVRWIVGEKQKRAWQLANPSAARPRTPIACVWGTIFEPVAERMLELEFSTRLYGSDVCIRGPFPGCHYSPDGMFVVSLDSAGTMVPCADEPATVSKVLAEFKCPFTRKPDGTIASNYEAQIKMGLAVIQILDFGVLIDVSIRVCAVTELSFGSLTFNYDFHRPGRNHLEVPTWETLPYALGVSAVYMPADRTACPDFATHAMDEVGGHVDIGQSWTGLITSTFWAIDSKLFRIVHADPWKPSAVKSSRQYDLRANEFEKNTPDGYTIFGFLAWKIFDLHVIPVEKEDGFLDARRENIEEISLQLTTIDVGTHVDRVDDVPDRHRRPSDF